MPLTDSHISLAHGNGGRFMRELIEQIFARHLGNPLLDVDADAVAVPVPDGEVVVTTDGFIVAPLEFPGGNIGALAVNGTVNDLAVSGAEPHYLTLNAFIEEGLAVEILERVIASLAAAAQDAGVSVVAGDTKVVQRGEGGGLYLATTGVGVREPQQKLGMAQIQAGDAGLKGELYSDCASVLPLTRALRAIPGLRFMRDPTRGGLATVSLEIARATGLGVRLHEARVPVRPAVQSVCEMLGYDPYYLACEGRVVAVVAQEDADQALAAVRAAEGGAEAAIIGHTENGSPHVVLETELGGERLLEELEDDPLPRIC
jgi:hydrogenase expression/formation protein HypE